MSVMRAVPGSLRVRIVGAALLAALAPGCPETGAPCGDGAPPEASEDAGGDPAAEADETADEGPRDAADDNSAPEGEAGSLWHVVRTDGTDVVGERIATYDRNRWWNDSGPELIHALFDPDAFSDYPDDRSVTVVSSLDVAEIALDPWPAGRAACRDFLRARGIVIARVPLDGPVLVVTGNSGHHLEENGYGDFAWDLVVTDAHGSRLAGDGGGNEDYAVWDAEVRLPTAGIVVEVVRDEPDNEPGSYEPGSPANMVGIRLGGSFYLYLLHFRQGTIPAAVEVGAALPAGRFVGRAGNSGVSLEPHLHVALLWYDESALPPRSWSVPGEFSDVWASRSPIGPAVRHDAFVPDSGTWISSEPF